MRAAVLLFLASYALSNHDLRAEGMLGRIVEVGAGFDKANYCVFAKCTDVSVLARSFNPRDNDAHICKEILVGGPHSVEMWMCTVEKGGVISMAGDLVVVILNRTENKVRVESKCQSRFVPAMEFMPKTFNGWGTMTVSLGPEKRHDFYIVEPQLSKPDREIWRLVGENQCTWTVELHKEDRHQGEVFLKPNDQPGLGWEATITNVPSYRPPTR